MIKDKYIKNLDALKQIQKICKDNDFGNIDTFRYRRRTK